MRQPGDSRVNVQADDIDDLLSQHPALENLNERT